LFRLFLYRVIKKLLLARVAHTLFIMPSILRTDTEKTDLEHLLAGIRDFSVL
jgi:hypothetical protein